MQIQKSFARYYAFLIFLCLSTGIAVPCHSQVSQVSRSNGIPEMTREGNADPALFVPLKFPWAGGMNSCQFCSIDLNLDGIGDLLIFDRHGNRKLTFINHGTPGSVDYTLSPEYERQLPDLHDWVITVDYDLDGKKDIFTYGSGGVRVFKNISDTSLKFRLVTGLLESFYYTGKVGILVTSVDYPALADIDNDGDLDLLTFFGLGAYVEYHRNMSVERYGNSDSLDYRLADPCWGKFKESEGGNRIILDAGCPYDESGSQVINGKLPMTNPRHTGSTLLATDLNGDGLKDLIIGDVDYPGLVALINGGTTDTAFMISQDTSFPSNSVPVRLFSFPAVSLIDIDNDGRDDLLISPFDPALYTSDNYNCVQFYKNTGTGVLPGYELQPGHLFRDEMMDFGSASHPVLYDFNGDGLQDLFVGNDGLYDSSYYKEAVLHSVYTSRVAYFKNIGTVNGAIFQYVTNDLAGISAMKLRGAFPAFGDLNGDGHPDMVIGNSDGTLIFFRNSGTGTPDPAFHAPVLNWQNIDIGEYSAPQLFDLDKDGDPDLVIGEQNGNINYYENTGSAENPEFSFVTDSLGKVNVTNYNISYSGFSTPCFSRLADGTTILLAGSDEGRLHLYDHIDQNLSGKFTERDTLFKWLSPTPGDSVFGWQTSPAIGHLSDHLRSDLITGNFAGGLNYVSKGTPAEIIPGTRELYSASPGSLTVHPNPADQAVNISLPGNKIPAPGSRLMILNLLGQKVADHPFAGTTTFSVSFLAPGIYIIIAGGARAKLVISRP